jgi:trans-aconitate 2-methyltransferase
MARAEWDPEQYARFSEARMRPARELLARIPDFDLRTIFDLGCGDGPVTELLTARWPAARVIGIDSSPAMLAKARTACPSVLFLEADVATWQPPEPADLVFSNAALHWIDDHEHLMPALLRNVAPGGHLAVQTPANFDAPSHRLLVELARSSAWRTRLAPIVRQTPVAEIQRYIDWLSPLSDSIDAWETTDYLMLDGDDAVLEWMSGSALRPFLAALTVEDGARFRRELATLLAGPYPRRPDGRTLFPFARRYFVARRQRKTGSPER